MGYLSCNGDSAVSICDTHNWHNLRRSKTSFPQLRIFTYDELSSATNGFSAGNFLAKGSHGRVYRAVLDGGNKFAAVKRTALNNNNNNNNLTQFDNEIEILSRFRHRYMVNLIGYCIDHRRKTKLLVMDYIPNGTLYDHLHSPYSFTSWNRRIKHALQIAVVVHALHSADTPIIHRDIKSSNILIDGDGNARLADFGLALIGRADDEHLKATPPAGTLGYLDPSYLAPEDLTAKNDVFSFGILLLEMISGREAIDLKYSPSCIVDWAVPMIKRGNFDDICDLKFGKRRPESVVIRKIAVLAAKCVRSTAKRRPDMAEVVECLKTVRNMSQASLVWNKLRRRSSENKPENVFVVEENEEINVRVLRSGSRRQSKVSNVAEEKPLLVSPLLPPVRRRSHVARSRSMGAVMGQARVGPDPNENMVVTIRILVEKEREVAAAVAAEKRLRKSKSVGMVRSSHKTPSRKRV